MFPAAFSFFYSRFVYSTHLVGMKQRIGLTLPFLFFSFFVACKALPTAGRGGGGWKHIQRQIKRDNIYLFLYYGMKCGVLHVAFHPFRILQVPQICQLLWDIF